MKRNSDTVVIVGTGEGVLDVDLQALRDKGYDIMAFQEAYPHMSIKPDVWTFADPNSSLTGLRTIPPEELPTIVLPFYLAEDFATYRMYCGTTPVGRVPGGWEEYSSLLERAEPELFYAATSSKYLELNPYEDHKLTKKDWTHAEAVHRFEYMKIVFGTVRFDSESVQGERFKWGLESKLSSTALPLAHKLGYKRVLCCGFGMKGGRFFDVAKTRMPFNDETQSGSKHEFPLSVIKRWVDWKKYHGMDILSLEGDSISYLNEVMERYDD
jgi:hypothetical protein